MKLPNRNVEFSIYHKNIYKKTVVRRQTVIRYNNGLHASTVPGLGLNAQVFKDKWEGKVKYRAQIFIQFS